jgi:hypothetical protein
MITKLESKLAETSSSVLILKERHLCSSRDHGQWWWHAGCPQEDGGGVADYDGDATGEE